jgi:hypothetical protein
MPLSTGHENPTLWLLFPVSLLRHCNQLGYDSELSIGWGGCIRTDKAELADFERIYDSGQTGFWDSTFLFTVCF